MDTSQIQEKSTIKDLYGLIGKTLSHSYSANYFNEKFQKENIPARYLLLELNNIDAFPDLIQEYPILKGLNVTIPYKEAILPYVTEKTAEVSAIGATNVIKIIRTSHALQIIAHNTDAFAFRRAIQPFLQNIHDKALILGTGGAAKAAAYSLKNMGIEVFFVSRNTSDIPHVISYTTLNKQIFQLCKFIINATPVGMFPHTEKNLPIPFQYLTPDHFVFDMIYNPAETIFLRKAREAGAVTENGLNMLYFQAEESWNFWTTSPI